MNIFQEWIDDIRETSTNFLKINKMTADKQISLENKFIEFEINSMYKLFSENAELNKKYHYIKSVKEEQRYTLPANLTKVLGVNFIQGVTKFKLTKLKSNDTNAAQTFTETNINPSYYDDASVYGDILIYPSPQYDGDLIELFAMFETDTLTNSTDILTIPVKFQPACRNYLLNRIQILCGIMHENANAVTLLDSLDKKLIVEAIACRRMRDFNNPDREKFIKGAV